MSRVILWRHGNTDWNNQNRFQGQTDVPLNERGVAEAAAAAAKLALLKPDLLISSDLSRAVNTAAALAKVTGLPVERDMRLRERNFGEWETLTGPEVEQKFPEAFARWRAGDPTPAEYIERVADLGKRVAETVRQAAERVPDGLAVLVTHGGSVKWGVAALLGWPEEAGETLRGIGNCHHAELVLDSKRGWVLVSYNVGV